MTAHGAIYLFVALTFLYALVLQMKKGKNRRHGSRIRRRTVRHPLRTANRQQRMYIYRRDGGLCHYCLLRGIRRPVHYRTYHRRSRWSSCDDCGEIDHKKAHSKGGPTTVDNLVLACWDCNRRKGARDYDEFVRNG